MEVREVRVVTGVWGARAKRIRRNERVDVEKEKGVMVKGVGVCGGTEEKNVGGRAWAMTRKDAIEM